jgi:hypothetical protein
MTHFGATQRRMKFGFDEGFILKVAGSEQKAGAFLVLTTRA